MKANLCQLKKANTETNMRVVELSPSWELAIADAEERIAQLKRSVEMFKHNLKAGVPWPDESSTQ